jgi:hypothetical protein
MESMNQTGSERIENYRAQATLTRKWADQSVTDDNRAHYLRLAAEWDKLANEIEAGTFADRRV